MAQFKTHAIDEADVVASNPAWGFDPGDTFTFDPGTMPFYDVTITDTGADQTTLSGDPAPGTNSDGGPNADNEGTDNETATVTDQSGTPYGTQNQRVAVDKSGVLNGSDGSTINIYEIETYDDIDLYTFSAPLVPGVTYTVASVVHDSPMSYGGIICFAAGTRISTPAGERPVENLRVGDSVRLADGGTAPIVWTGARYVSVPAMHASPNLAPIRIAANALGCHAELLVSPQHRLQLSGRNARALSGTGRCLVSAKLLAEEIGGPFSRVVPPGGVGYHHVMCPGHETVLANGLPAETFYPGRSSIAMCTPAARLRLFRLFPGLATARTDAEIARLYGALKHPSLSRKAIRAARTRLAAELAVI